MLHGCLANSPSRRIRHAHQLALTPDLVHLLVRSPTTPALSPDRPASGSPLMPHDRAHGRATGARSAPEQDHRRRPVPRDVGPEVSMTWVRSTVRKELLDQLLAELPLHEGVGGDQPDVARAFRPVRLLRHGCKASWKNRSVKGTASEYCRWQVRVPLSVELVERLVLDRDVGRIADHRMIALAEDAVQLVQVFRRSEGMFRSCSAPLRASIRPAPRAVQPPRSKRARGAGCPPRRRGSEVRRVLEPLHPGAALSAATSSRKRAMATA